MAYRTPHQAALARVKRKNTKKGQQREPKPGDFWKLKLPPRALTPNDFRLVARRGGRGRPDMRIDGIAESFEWVDEGPMLTGSLTLRDVPHEVPRGKRKPMYLDHPSVTVGDVIVCSARGRGDRVGGRWEELWRMRVEKPTWTFREGQIAYELADLLSLLRRSEYDFKYVKTKAKGRRPNGWLPHVIAADVCKTCGIKVGSLAPGTVYIKKLQEEKIDPISFIEQAYEKETAKTGRQYIVSLEGGRLYVRQRRRSREMLILAPQIVEAQLTAAKSGEHTTAFDVHATIKDGKKKKKIEFFVQDREARRRYGLIRRTLKLGRDAASKAIAKRMAMRRLRDSAEPVRELTITHPGIPTLRRGHAMRLGIDEARVRKQVVFAASVNHSVSAGTYDMQVTVGFDDPFVEMDDVIAKKQIKEKNRKRKRRGEKSDSKPPKPKKAKQRERAEVVTVH